jgi:hypothetical protein
MTEDRRRPQRSEVRDQRSEARGQRAVSLSVISYSLFGSSVAMSCLEDFYDFNGFNDLTNRLIF